MLRRSIYGSFVDDIFPLAITSVINSSLGLCYSIIFLLSTKDRAAAIKCFIIVCLVTAAFALYAILAYTNQACANTGNVFGYVASISAATPLVMLLVRGKL